MADYIHHLTQKTVIEIIIGLDTEMFAVKMDIGLVFEIDRNSIHMEIFLAEQVWFMVYLVYYFIIFIFKNEYLLISCRILFQLL